MGAKPYQRTAQAPPILSLPVPALIRGRLVRRYKRFLADIETESGEMLTVHCPNPGAMTGTDRPGAQVRCSTSDNPKRKLPHTLEMVRVGRIWVGVHTLRANQLVARALAADRLPGVQGYPSIRPEVPVPGGSRLDFGLTEHPEDPRPAWLEVKSVTLAQGDTAATAMNIGLENIAPPKLAVAVANTSECVDLYTDRVWGVHLQMLLDIAHGISAALVSFARGLNDTPKIAGLLVAAQAFDIKWGMVAIAVGIALGGLLNARRVAETISNKITDLNHGQGFSANLVTGILVIFASNLGLPVSTTHVSVGSIFGIGMVTGKRNTKVIGNILIS